MKADLTLGDDGTLTLPPEALAHLEAQPGQKLRLTLAEDGSVILSPVHAAPGARLLRNMLGKPRR